ncbi:hypothetical protein AB0M05_47265 [Streptomyces violaceusniger]
MFAKKKPGVEYPPYVTVPRQPGEPRATGQPPVGRPPKTPKK